MTLSYAAMLLAPVCLLAQRPDQWSRVQTLRPGALIEVREAQGMVTGTFVRASDDSIVMSWRGSDRVIGRSVIERVRERKGRRGKRALIGMAIGGGGAWTVGAVGLRSLDCGLGCEDGAAVAFGMGLIGAGLGAAIGGVLPIRWETVFER